jgi:hypothetical protein
LEPVDFHNLNNAGSHKLNAAVRLSYLPDPVIPDEIRGYAAYTVIPSITIREIRQIIAGAFGNWEYERLRLIGELYFVSNDLVADSGTARALFINYNLQAEYTPHPNWTLYARAEDTLNAENDPYLDIFPEFIPKVDLKTGRVTGVEALVRWQHPRQGLFLPEHFLHLA